MKSAGNLPGKLVTLCLAVLIVLSVEMPVKADEKAAKTGSIQLQLPKSQEELEISLYKVADLKDGAFIFSSDFAKSGVSVSNLNDDKAAQTAVQELEGFAKKYHPVSIKAVPDDNGIVNFTGLSPALYLTTQSGEEKTILIQAALVPVPYLNQKGEETYDVVILPKYSLRREPIDISVTKDVQVTEISGPYRQESIPSTGAKTGDNTPIGSFTALLILAAAIGVAVYKKRSCAICEKVDYKKEVLLYNNK